MKMPKYHPRVRKEVLEKDVFRLDYILRTGKKGHHVLFEDDKITTYMDASSEESRYLSESEEKKYKSMMKEVIVLPNVSAKKDYIQTLSFKEQKTLFNIYLNMVDHYQPTENEQIAH